MHRSFFTGFFLVFALYASAGFAANTWVKPRVGGLLHQVVPKCFNIIGQAAEQRRDFPTRSFYRTASMRWRHLIADLVRTEYLSSEELARVEIEFNREENFWFYKQSGEKVPEGEYTTVMASDGRIYVYSPSITHGAGSRGRPVAAAGEVSFNSGGNIIGYRPETGHYWRNFRTTEGQIDPHLNWMQFIQELSARGAPVEGVEILRLRHRSPRQTEAFQEPGIYGFLLTRDLVLEMRYLGLIRE